MKQSVQPFKLRTSATKSSFLPSQRFEIFSASRRIFVRGTGFERRKLTSGVLSTRATDAVPRDREDPRASRSFSPRDRPALLRFPLAIRQFRRRSFRGTWLVPRQPREPRSLCFIVGKKEKKGGRACRHANGTRASIGTGGLRYFDASRQLNRA